MAFRDGTADFRSDTVTRPTDEMREAMAAALVGDDVYRDDPTVNSLEEEAAAIVGKDAAVFVPTGTMGNQLAVMVQTSPGEEVLVDEFAHIRNVERGWGPAHAGIGWRGVVTDGGWITPEQVDTVMELAGSVFPRVSLIAFENSHNYHGGRVTTAERLAETAQRAHHHGLRVHIDGARMFNAAVATGVEPAVLASMADTVQFCFSKGLGAPIGSIVCGSADVAEEIRYRRKRLGGGMRQAGIVAAAARIALRDWKRLEEDHQLARYLATGIAGRWPGSVEPSTVETNIVNVSVGSFPDGHVSRIRDGLGEAGIVTSPPRAGTWRLVTHRDVDRADADRLVAVLDT